MTLPDNVTANTEYVVRSTDDIEGFNDIAVTRGESGNVKIKQDSDVVILVPADVHGLIAALQAVASIGAEQITDDEGDVWVRQPDGKFKPIRSGLSHVRPHSRDEIERCYGIRGTA